MDESKILDEVIRSTQSELKLKKVMIPEAQAPRIITAVAESFLTQLIFAAKKQAIDNGGVGTLSFAQLIDINFSNRESEVGEKDGNVMVSFVPGPQAKLIAKEDSATESEED